ncbi:hypothetical protein KFE98_11620 [bacterium SCSIO 12741]|nr:hypothetical protein KFE98_11620 [bacterium SCSIO 12741]
MLRNLFVFLHLFPLIFLPTYEYKKEELKVELVAPEKAEAGSEFTVELKFTPGEVKGFTKYTETLPEGLTAEAGELGNASFTFANGQIKIFWVEFPEKEPFTISYKVKVASGVQMTADIGGKFSYIENNEKRAFHIPKKQIAIGSADQLAAAEASQQETKVAARASVKRRVVSSQGTLHTIEITIDKEGIEGFSRIQEYVPMGGKVTKGDTKNASFSFVKNKARFVWMAVPQDQIVTITYDVDLSGASNQDVTAIYGEFSYLDDGQTVKKDILFGDEMMASNEGSTEESPSTQSSSSSTSSEESNNNSSISSGNGSTGTGAAVAVAPVKTQEPEETEETEESSTEETTATATSEEEETTTEETSTMAQNETATQEEEVTEVTAEETTTEEEVKEDVVLTETLTNTDTEEEATEEEATEVVEAQEENNTTETEESNPVSASNNDNLGNTSPIPSPNTGVNYRVQIAAGHNIVDAAYFQKKHNWSQEFILENHQGWVKYTTGSYLIYKDARDSREEINAGGYQFDGPFVTAYNNGERITVQEALMITRQKWFK